MKVNKCERIRGRVEIKIKNDLDVMMARRKMSLTELSDQIGITLANLSILKSGKAKAIRFSTLEEICRILNCQPGDILEYMNHQDFKKLMRE